jgi:prepilin peptidase CpaA
VSVPSWLPLIVLAGLCCAGAWLDATQRRLPNWLCALLAVLGLAIALVLDGPGAAGSHGLHMAAALVVGLALFSVRMIGGGDAKFYAGVASWFALSKAAELLLWVSLSGLVLFVGWFVYRRTRHLPIRPTGDNPSDSLPYGLAIGAGAIISALL